MSLILLLIKPQKLCKSKILALINHELCLSPLMEGKIAYIQDKRKGEKFSNQIKSSDVDSVKKGAS